MIMASSVSEAGDQLTGAALVGCFHQIAAEAGQLVMGGTDRDDLAGDEVVPSRYPRQDRVVDQLGHAGGQQEALKAQPSGGAEGLEGLERIVGQRLDRFEYADRHVPRLAGEDQEYRGHLDPEAAVRERDEEINRGGEEPDHRDRLGDVDRGQHHAFPCASFGGQEPVDQREDEREDVGRRHPHQRAEGIVG